jgi:hypothetical protein
LRNAPNTFCVIYRAWQPSQLSLIHQRSWHILDNVWQNQSHLEINHQGAFLNNYRAPGYQGQRSGLTTMIDTLDGLIDGHKGLGEHIYVSRHRKWVQTHNFEGPVLWGWRIQIFFERLDRTQLDILLEKTKR